MLIYRKILTIVHRVLISPDKFSSEHPVLLWYDCQNEWVEIDILLGNSSTLWSLFNYIYLMSFFCFKISSKYHITFSSHVSSCHIMSPVCESFSSFSCFWWLWQSGEVLIKYLVEQLLTGICLFLIFCSFAPTMIRT